MTRTIGATLLALSLLSALAIAAEPGRSLTLQQAREEAVKKNPRITAAELRALAAKQSAREAQAGFFPSVSVNLGAVAGAEDDTRIANPSLTASSVFDRVSLGVLLNQLVTDFGRTSNLTEGSRLRAQAEAQNSVLTRARLLLEVDAIYYSALQAQSVRRVTTENVKMRQLLRDQVSALTSNQLKSELDLSFAEVGLQEARLAMTRAENDVQSTYASLATLIGSREDEVFQLAEDALPDALMGDASEAVSAALRNRPDLQRLRLEGESAAKFAKSEDRLSYPTVSIQGAAGVIPYHEDGLNDDYAAAGIILNWQLFNGGANQARKQAAALRAEAALATIREEENNAVRDVRISWINANNAWERLAVAQKLLEHARRNTALAEARYKAGSSSIVELNQAQLNLISAEIAHVVARYEYFVRRSILAFQSGELH